MPGEQPFIVEWPEEDLAAAAQEQAEREAEVTARRATNAKGDSMELERARLEAERLQLDTERQRLDEERRQIEEKKIAEALAVAEARRQAEYADAERRREQEAAAERLRQEGAARQTIEAALVEKLRVASQAEREKTKPADSEKAPWGTPSPPVVPSLPRVRKQGPLFGSAFDPEVKAVGQPQPEPEATEPAPSITQPQPSPPSETVSPSTAAKRKANGMPGALFRRPPAEPSDPT